MKLGRTQPRPQHETIVALIDVVFFLLVFFMLVGRMDATAPFQVVPPMALSGSDLPAGGNMVFVGREGELAFNGMAREQDELLTDIARALQADPAALWPWPR